MPVIRYQMNGIQGFHIRIISATGFMGNNYVSNGIELRSDSPILDEAKLFLADARASEACLGLVINILSLYTLH